MFSYNGLLKMPRESAGEHWWLFRSVVPYVWIFVKLVLSRWNPETNFTSVSTSVLQAKCAAGKPTKAPDYIRVCMEWISYVYTVQKFEIKILLSYEEVMLIKAIYLINNTGRKTVMCVILLQVKITVSMLIYFKI